MFDVSRRREVRERLIARAHGDDRIVGAALTGSAARNAEDRWSDVDVFLGVAAGASVGEAVEDWSAFLYAELGALHHFELHVGSVTYRAFLLEELLEVDLGFAPADEFGPLGDGAFKVVFGRPVGRQPNAIDPDHLIGLAWHHVLHARVCIERDDPLQAEYWISTVRDYALALACLRLGYPASYAKGVRHLPATVTTLAQDALVRSLDTDELSRALQAAAQVLLQELRAADPVLAARLAPSLLIASRGLAYVCFPQRWLMSACMGAAPLRLLWGRLVL